MASPSTPAQMRVGHNVRMLRDRDGLSGERLAELMTERGCPWVQQTVGRTEKGLRATRADELEQLAQIFGVEVGRLLWASGEAQAAEALAAQERKLVTAWENAVHALIALETARGASGALMRAYAEIAGDPEKDAAGRIARERGKLGKSLEAATRDSAISEADRLRRKGQP